MILTTGMPDRKILKFLTNREYYYKLKRNMPPSNREKVNTQLFSCRRIINNVLDDESIAGICFNATENNHVTVEKEILTVYIQEGLLVKIMDQ